MIDMDERPQYISAKDLAGICGISLDSVHRKLRNGILPVELSDKPYKWRLDDISKYFEDFSKSSPQGDAVKKAFGKEIK
ncbi:MAG: hypothetical protein H7829_17170 [Magnetococcus sp. THC-1_WYH]